MTSAKKSTYPGRVLKLGTHGGTTERLQSQLNKVRNSAASAHQPKLAIDGEYGKNTERRVRQFQAHHGLTVDGEVGPVTWAKLFDEPLPPQPKKPLRLKAFAQMSHLVGVMEVGGNNMGPMVSTIIREAGGGGPEPWCGDTVFYAYNHAGSKAVKGMGRKFAYVPWISTVAGVKVIPATEVKRGDIVRFQWDTGPDDHTGLFDCWIVKGRSFYSLEGNTGKDPNVSDSTSGGDGVHRRERTINLVGDFLRVTR